MVSFSKNEHRAIHLLQAKQLYVLTYNYFKAYVSHSIGMKGCLIYLPPYI